MFIDQPWLVGGFWHLFIFSNINQGLVGWQAYFSLINHRFRSSLWSCNDGCRCIYCPPHHAASVLRIIPDTKQVEMIGAAGIQTPAGAWSSSLGPGWPCGSWPPLWWTNLPGKSAIHRWLIRWFTSTKRWFLGWSLGENNGFLICSNHGYIHPYICYIMVISYNHIVINQQ